MSGNQFGMQKSGGTARVKTLKAKSPCENPNERFNAATKSCQPFFFSKETKKSEESGEKKEKK